ncbi:HNH endonuclease [Isoptericola dokdonensis]|uniref:HNH endonuclease n=1 Tax=Isoptericola dokdonensis DS-3 TaxID=1300344 RepID=A0A168FDJ8_9MICO|nr:HNH endonuclease signature motif containing protein [Isoptericola dokdonensis]ANC31446.1 HNH endonuclease [Isoptericola dokdonensis DS-3]
MPTGAPSRCLVHGCRQYAHTRGRCEQHYVPWERPSANTRTLTRHQRRTFSAAVLDRDQVCQAHGCTAPATEADHIVEIADGGSGTDPANGQGLCHEHHQHKTQLARRARQARRRT